MDGYDRDSVSKQLVNGFIYIIVYKNPDGMEKRYRVFVDRNGDIVSQNPEPTDEEKEGEKGDDMDKEKGEEKPIIGQPEVQK